MEVEFLGVELPTDQNGRGATLPTPEFHASIPVRMSLRRTRDLPRIMSELRGSRVLAVWHRRCSKGRQVRKFPLPAAKVAGPTPPKKPACAPGGGKQHRLPSSLPSRLFPLRAHATRRTHARAGKLPECCELGKQGASTLHQRPRSSAARTAALSASVCAKTRF